MTVSVEPEGPVFWVWVITSDTSETYNCILIVGLLRSNCFIPWTVTGYYIFLKFKLYWDINSFSREFNLDTRCGSV